MLSALKHRELHLAQGLQRAGHRARRIASVKKALLSAVAVASAALVVTVGVAAPANAAPKKSHKVTLSGDLAGDYFNIRPKAKLVTSTKYKETWIKVRVDRLPTDTGNRTPMFTVTIDGTSVTCETFRPYVWDTDTGSLLQVNCDGYLKPKKVRKAKTATISDAL